MQKSVINDKVRKIFKNIRGRVRANSISLRAVHDNHAAVSIGQCRSRAVDISR